MSFLRLSEGRKQTSFSLYFQRAVKKRQRTLTFGVVSYLIRNALYLILDRYRIFFNGTWGDQNRMNICTRHEVRKELADVLQRKIPSQGQHASSFQQPVMLKQNGILLMVPAGNLVRSLPLTGRSTLSLLNQPLCLLIGHGRFKKTFPQIRLLVQYEVS